MSLGKLVTLGVLGALAWQHQALILSKAEMVKDAVPTFQTYQAMRAMRDPLAQYAQDHGGRLPRNVSAWIARSFSDNAREEVGFDHFGNPYRITYDQERQPHLRSCGPDGECGNSDDLVIKVGKPLAR